MTAGHVQTHFALPSHVAHQQHRSANINWHKLNMLLIPAVLLFYTDLLTFVDDERVTRATFLLTWQTGRQIACIQTYLGIKDDVQKVGECTKQPRSWAGAVVHVVPQQGVCVLTSDEKW